MITFGFIDPLRMVVFAYRNALPSLSETEDAGRRELVLIRDNWKHPNLDKWGTAKAAIAKARRLAEKQDYRMTRAAVEAMAPHTALPWVPGLSDELLLYYNLTSCPGFALYEGVQAQHPAPGELWVMGGGPAMRCVVNHGETEVLNVVLILKRQEDA